MRLESGEHVDLPSAVSASKHFWLKFCSHPKHFTVVGVLSRTFSMQEASQICEDSMMVGTLWQFDVNVVIGHGITNFNYPPKRIHRYVLIDGFGREIY